MIHSAKKTFKLSATLLRLGGSFLPFLAPFPFGGISGHFNIFNVVKVWIHLNISILIQTLISYIKGLVMMTRVLNHGLQIINPHSIRLQFEIRQVFIGNGGVNLVLRVRAH